MSSDEKGVIVGDDPIDNVSQDWYGFDTHVRKLSDFLYDISKTSSVCCGLLGEWGTGKTSFLRLMRKYIQSRTEWNAEDIWFVAWDPGGIESLGDAILYHIYTQIAKVAENDSSEEGKAIITAYNEVKRSLGIRKGIRERITDIRDKLSGIESLPIIKDLASLTNSAIDEFTSGQVIRTSVQTLCEYVEKQEITVFLFVDELDRASGEQIFSILSELKAYINHRRIVIVLGYDEDYIHDALSTQLPDGVDVNEYIKKIITLRKNIPNPNRQQLRDFSSEILRTYLPSVDEEVISRLSMYSTTICDFNPRKLKRLVLSFLQHIPSETQNINRYASLLLTTALDEEGFLNRHDVLESFNTIDSERLQEILSEVTDSELISFSRVILRTLEHLERTGAFYTDMIKYLGIPQYGYRSRRQLEEKSERPVYNWRTSLIPIVTNASIHKPQVPGHLVSLDKDFQISNLVQYIDLPVTWQFFSRYVTVEMKPFFWTSNDYNLYLIVSSIHVGIRSVMRIIGAILNNAPVVTLEKPFVIWLIDDNASQESRYEMCIERSRSLSEGLKNDITVLITRSDQIDELLSYLLSVAFPENPLKR